MRIPEEVKAGQPVSAADYNALLRYVRALTLRPGPGYRVAMGPGGTVLSVARGGTGGPVSGAHPFRISVVFADPTWTATVSAGPAHAPKLYQDADGYATAMMASTWITATTLTGLANNTTYGIWLEGTTSTPGAGSVWENPVRTSTIDSKFGAPEKVVGSNPTPYIIAADSTNTDYDDVYAKVIAGTGSQFAYIGQVAIASGVVTIDQWVRSDIYLAMATWGHGIVSSDANNDITAGSDGGVFYEV